MVDLYARRAVLTLAKNPSKCNSFESHYIGKDNPWLTFLEDDVFESEEHIFLELHATAMLCLPSGECLRPDATVCVALMSALYASVTEEVVLDRQLMVLPSSSVLLHMFVFTRYSYFATPRQVCIFPGRKFLSKMVMQHNWMWHNLETSLLCIIYVDLCCR